MLKIKMSLGYVASGVCMWIWVCAYFVSVCVLFVSVCVCYRHGRGYISLCAHKGRKRMLSVMLYPSPSWDWIFYSTWVRMAGRKIKLSFYSSPQEHQGNRYMQKYTYFYYIGTRDMNSGPHAYITNSFVYFLPSPKI